jgi:hypothetical protein
LSAFCQYPTEGWHKVVCRTVRIPTFKPDVTEQVGESCVTKMDSLIFLVTDSKFLLCETAIYVLCHLNSFRNEAFDKKGIACQAFDIGSCRFDVGKDGFRHGVVGRDDQKTGVKGEALLKAESAGQPEFVGASHLSANIYEDSSP